MDVVIKVLESNAPTARPHGAKSGCGQVEVFLSTRGLGSQGGGWLRLVELARMSAMGVVANALSWGRML
jgi:hypothetical protein